MLQADRSSHISFPKSKKCRPIEINFAICTVRSSLSIMKLPTYLVICLAGGWIRIKQPQAIVNLPRMAPRPVTRLARCSNSNPNLVVSLYRIIELGTKSSHRSSSMKSPTCSFLGLMKRNLNRNQLVLQTPPIPVVASYGLELIPKYPRRPRFSKRNFKCYPPLPRFRYEFSVWLFIIIRLRCLRLPGLICKFIRSHRKRPQG